MNTIKGDDNLQILALKLDRKIKKQTTTTKTKINFKMSTCERPQSLPLKKKKT